MTDEEFNDVMKMLEACRIAYRRGLITKAKWTQIEEAAKLYAETAKLVEALNDDDVLSEEVIDG